MEDIAKKGQLKTGQLIGFAAGIVVLLVFWFADVTPGLSEAGRHFLGLILTSVIWWATKPIAPPLTALFLMAGVLLFNIAPVANVASFTGGMNFFLYFAAFIIADVVEKTGLGKRVAYLWSIRFIKSWGSMIVSAFVLTFILGFLIPHPFPRCFILLAVFTAIGQSCGLNERDSRIIGFLVFAASCPVSTMTLTGDGGLNVALSSMVTAATGLQIGWMDWTVRMFLPGLVATIVFIILFFIFFKPSAEIKVDASIIKNDLKELGPMSRDEKVTLLWIVVAVILWVTEPMHHIPTAVVCLLTVIMMSIPFIGGVCKPPNLKSVEFGNVLYIMAAFMIGGIGGLTGLSKWLADLIFPASVPANPLVMAVMIGGVTLIIHMFLGSCLSTASVVVPMSLAFTGPAGLNPLCIALIVYTTVYLHWLFPFQSMNVMIGTSRVNILQSDVFRIGIPMTVLVFVIILIEAAFWSTTGLLYA